MAAGTYIKFIGVSGTLTGTNGTIWAEAVDPDYAQTLEAELQSDQGSGVPTIAMPILDSGVAAAVQAAAADGTLQIEVAGYNDQGQLTNDILLGTTTVGSETVTTSSVPVPSDPAPVAQTLSLQPTSYSSRTTTYDPSGTATNSLQAYDFATGMSVMRYGPFSAPSSPTSIASAATADTGVMPFDGTALVLTTANGTMLEPSEGGSFSFKIPPDQASSVSANNQIVTLSFTSNLTNTSSGTTGSVAFSTNAGAESPSLLAAFFQGSSLDSVRAFQVGKVSGQTYAQSDTTFDAMAITNVDISLSPGADTRTYQLQTTQPGAGQSSTYTVNHWAPSGAESTQSLTLGAGTPGVGQVSTTAPTGLEKDLAYKLGIGSGSSAASYVLDDAAISFAKTSDLAEVSPLTLTFANAADATIVAADFAAGSQTITIQQSRDTGGGSQAAFDTLTFQTAPQTVSGMADNANGSETFNVSVLAYQEQFSGTQANGVSAASSSGPFELEGVHGGSSFQQAPCYVTGTRIRTTRGDVAVEALAVGDLAVTASGDARPIRWLGHRTIDCQGHPSPHDAHPVRISAHAFAPNQPTRDLFLSPGHPVLVGADEDNDGGHLVPIMCLINGMTVRREAVEEVTYWHVELDAHDILLAENLPAESYIDLGSRLWFAGADGALYDPDMAAPGLPGRCRPVAIDGPMVEAERRRLDGLFATHLAAACAWPGTEDPLPAM